MEQKSMCACGCGARVRRYGATWASRACVPKSVLAEAGKRSSHGRTIVSRLCACGCGSVFSTIGRNQCLNRDHAQTWRERRFEQARSQHFAAERRKKFGALIAAALKDSRSLRESDLLTLCQNVWARGYDSGYRRAYQAQRRVKMASDSAECAA